MSQIEIPNGWESVKLEKVAKIQTGLAKGKKNLKDPIRRPYLRVANVQDGYLDLSEIKEIEVERNQIERYLLKNGDVLLTEGGDNDKLGRGALWQGELQNCLHQNHIFVVRPHPEILLPYYLSSLTGSPYGKAYFRKAAKQSTNLASINTKQLKSFPVLLPPLPEQHKIIEILSTWDEAIVRTVQLIAVLQTRRKELMQCLLRGEVRFAEFVESSKKQESKIGRLPVDWKIKRLRDLTTLAFSNVDKKSNEQETTVRLCNYMDVFKNLFITNDMPFMIGSANAREIERFSLQKNDVVITKDSETAEEIAEAAVIATDLDNVICGYHLAILRPKQKLIDGIFLMYLLHEENVHFQFVRSANGITRFGLTTDSIQNALIPLPSLPEQEKIAATLISCDEELALLTKKLELLKNQKKGLMQRLLTGQVRVK